MKRIVVGIFAVVGSIVLGASSCQPPPPPPPTDLTYSLLSLGAGDTTGADVLGNDDVLTSAISADGNVIAFATLSTNVIPGDPRPGLFLRDQSTGEVTRLGGDVNLSGFNFGPSADGRFVTYVTREPLSPSSDITVHDRETGTTRSFVRQYGSSIMPVVSADGSSLIFGINSSPYSWYPNCEVVDIATGSSDACELGGTDRVPGQIGAVSSNGRFVVNRWTSADGAESGFALWDRDTGTVQDLPAYGQVMAISDDGRYLNMLDFDGAGQVDTDTGAIERPPAAAGDDTAPVAMSRDGRYVQLTPPPGTAGTHTFRWDTQTDVVEDLGEFTSGAFVPAPVCSFNLVTDDGGVCVNTPDPLDPIDDNAKTDSYLVTID